MKKKLSIFLVSSILLIAGNPIHDLMDNRIKGKSYTGLLDDNAAAEDGLGILPLSSYSITTDVANELLVQKILSDIERSETDLTKTVNIKDALISGTVGSVDDLNTFNSVLGNTVLQDLSPLTKITQVEMYGKTPGKLTWISGAGYGNTSSGICVDYTNQANSSYYNGMYFSQHIGTSEIQIVLHDTVRMWSQAASGAITYDANMLLYKWNTVSNTWDDVSSLLIGVKGRNSYDFYVASKTLTPGTYKFTRSNEFATSYNFDPYYGLRADNKWYFEKLQASTSYTAGTMSSCKQIKDAYPTSTDGVYNLRTTGNVYCDMTTDGGGWTLVSWNKGVSALNNADFFVTEYNKTNAANKDLSNYASSINAEGFSTLVGTNDAMLKSAAYSATPIIDKGFGTWNYSVAKCTGNLLHTARTYGCTQSANDNYDGADRFNIAIGNQGIVPYYLVNYGRELCYSGHGWCDFEFYLR